MSRGLVFQPLDLGELELGTDRRNNAFGESILQLEHVSQLAVEAIGPDMRPCCGVDELPSETEAIGTAANAALDDVTDAKFTSDLADVYTLAAIRERRVSSDHEQSRATRKRCDDLLGHPVREVVLFGTAAHVVERQNRDRRPIGQGEWRRRRVRAAIGRRLALSGLLAYLAHKPQPDAGHGLDQALLLAVVTDGGERRIDTCAHGRFRDNPTIPQRCTKIILGDDPLSVLDKIDQEIKKLSAQAGPQQHAGAVRADLCRLHNLRTNKAISRHIVVAAAFVQKVP